MKNPVFLLGPAVAAFALACAAATPPATFAGADWSEYSGGPARTHYSTLSQISVGNVARLQKAWEYHTGDPGEMQCNPLVVHGVLYGLTAANAVFALDAATGRERWRYTPPGEKADHVVRGLVYWCEDSDQRILFTWNDWLCALDARTGRLIPTFGQGGKTSLSAGLGKRAKDKSVSSTTPGTVFEDLIMMPLRVSETADAAMGFIQAFNIRTGKLVWVFHTIPSPGQFGYDTWSRNAYRNINVGSANCWAGMAVDRRRGILYVPTGSASPDFWGGDRLGNDLFADCLVALDARTGRLIWYYQFVHHDLWDRDLPAPPSLVTLRREGRKIDAVAQVTKTGFVYLFDRVTGKPLFPIREMPVPKSDLPGERASPTQPLPLWPAPFARQTLTAADISPFAPNRAELLARFRHARVGRFQPFGKYDTVLFPGFDGGAEWGGPAVDPRGVLYVNANEIAWIARLKDSPKPGAPSALRPGDRLYSMYCIACHGPARRGNPGSGIPSLVGVNRRLTREQVAQLIANGRGRMPGFPMIAPSDRQTLIDALFGMERQTSAAEPTAPRRSSGPIADYQPYTLDGYVKFLDSQGYPAIRPPWGSLTAIDLNSGKRLWRIPLGEFQELTARGIPPTGTQNYGGPVATAGGLLFIAATQDDTFRAFDRRTGKLLWHARLPASAFATPATYEAGGRQYVVIACGGTKLETKPGDSYVAFALPAPPPLPSESR